MRRDGGDMTGGNLPRPFCGTFWWACTPASPAKKENILFYFFRFSFISFLFFPFLKIFYLIVLGGEVKEGRSRFKIET
jgi:hypothetical protein